MTAVAIKENNRIHPHKFTMWVAIGSIVMMFAGLTSAYVVKRNQPKWQTFDLPWEFWISTVVVLLNSLTMWMALKAFKSRNFAKYKVLLVSTFALGVLFVVLQWMGFANLWNQGLTLRANAAYAFVYVIVGLHALHVIGGIVALLAMTLKAYSTRSKLYSSVPVEVLSTYWHFVDALWIYLLVFLWLIR